MVTVVPQRPASTHGYQLRRRGEEMLLEEASRGAKGVKCVVEASAAAGSSKTMWRQRRGQQQSARPSPTTRRAPGLVEWGFF